MTSETEAPTNKKSAVSAYLQHLQEKQQNSKVAVVVSPRSRERPVQPPERLPVWKQRQLQRGQVQSNLTAYTNAPIGAKVNAYNHAISSTSTTSIGRRPPRHPFPKDSTTEEQSKRSISSPKLVSVPSPSSSQQLHTTRDSTSITYVSSSDGSHEEMDSSTKSESLDDPRYTRVNHVVTVPEDDIASVTLPSLAQRLPTITSDAPYRRSRNFEQYRSAPSQRPFADERSRPTTEQSRSLVLYGEDGLIDPEKFGNNRGNDEDSFTALDRLIEETSSRWQNSSKLTASTATSTAPSTAMVLVSPSGSTTDSPEDIIARQQAEIECLKAQLMQQHSLVAYQQEDADEDSYHSPQEQIDQVPVEHVEVDHDDHLSVTSGLTNLNGGDLSRMNDDISTIILDNIPTRRPEADAESMHGRDNIAGIGASATPRGVGLRQRRVRNHELQLYAANGVSRKALYSGPLTAEGLCTGVGILKFEETGDQYTGAIVNGEMHGQGTYTYRQAKRAGKTLRGIFDHNVYTGWDSFR